jgi:hypothetical protein
VPSLERPTGIQKTPSRVEMTQLQTSEVDCIGNQMFAEPLLELAAVWRRHFAEEEVKHTAAAAELARMRVEVVAERDGHIVSAAVAAAEGEGLVASAVAAAVVAAIVQGHIGAVETVRHTAALVTVQEDIAAVGRTAPVVEEVGAIARVRKASFAPEMTGLELDTMDVLAVIELKVQVQPESCIAAVPVGARWVDLTGAEEMTLMLAAALLAAAAAELGDTALVQVAKLVAGRTRAALLAVEVWKDLEWQIGLLSGVDWQQARERSQIELVAQRL